MARPRVVTRVWTDRHGVQHQSYVVKRTHNGKAQQDSTWSRKKDAEERCRKWEQELEHGTYVPKGDECTFAYVKERFWAHCLWRNQVGDRMSGSRLRQLSAHLKPMIKEFGDDPINKIDAKRVQAWINGKAVETCARTGKIYKIRTLQAYLRDLDMVFGHALANDLGLKHNPLQNRRGEDLVKLPQRIDDQPDRFLEAIDAAQLLYWISTRTRRASCLTNVYRSETLAVLIAMLSGMRRGEICALQWPQIDWLHNLIHVRFKASLDEGVQPGTKAGRDKTRSVPLNPILRAALEAHYRLRGQPKTGFVLLNANGRRVQPNTISRVYWPPVCRGAGLVKENGEHRYRFHDLRHTAGSFWLADGMPLEEVSRLLGHAKVDTTWKVYIHQLQHDRRALQAVQNVSNRFVGLLAANGLQLPQAEPLQLEAPPPILDMLPATNSAAALPDELEDWEREAINMHRNGETLKRIGDRIGRDYRKVQEMLIAHGLYVRTERRGWRRLDQAAIDEAVARWQAGESTPVIAADFNVVENTIQRWARDAGATRTPLRPGAPRGPRGFYAYDAAVKENALAMWRAGKTCAAVGAVIGVNGRVVQRWVHLAGYRRRGKGWKSVASGQVVAQT